MDLIGLELHNLGPEAKFIAVKRAKFRGITICQNGKFRGRKSKFRGNFAVETVNFPVISRSKPKFCGNFAVKNFNLTVHN